MTHKTIETDGRKTVVKYLTERQIRGLQQRRSMWFQVDHTIIFLKPKAKNQKLLNKIQRYKTRIKELEAKVK